MVKAKRTIVRGGFLKKMKGEWNKKPRDTRIAYIKYFPK